MNKFHAALKKYSIFGMAAAAGCFVIAIVGELIFCVQNSGVH